MRRLATSLAVLTLLMASCSDEPLNSKEKINPSPSVESTRKDEMKTKFGKALAKSLSTNPSLRALIKEEALKMFDNDYDVLYHKVKNNALDNGSTVREVLLTNFNSNEELEQIEAELPLLNIFVPELPENSFSATAWDVNTQIPIVAITLSNTNDVRLVNDKGEESMLSSEYIPGFPVIVVKENERVIKKGLAYRSASRGRTLQVGDLEYVFLANCFDGSIVKKDKKTTRFTTVIDQKIIDAYNIYKTANGWHRDFIYYNITPDQPNGEFSYDYQEHVKTFSLQGDPASVYNKISDQTGDPKLQISKTPNSGWTGGFYEFKVNVLINAKNGIGSELTTFFSATPSDLFETSYEKLVVGGFFFGYKPSITALKKISVDLPLFNWDISNYATTIKINIEEVDLTETYKVTDVSNVKFATNFEIEPTSGLFQKIGLKFGASLEETQTQTVERTFTLQSDNLGDVIVNFADDIIIGATTSNTPVYTTREYSAGWYTLSIEPKCVQCN